MVDLSDDGDLMTKVPLAALPAHVQVRRAERVPSYLPTLAARGVELAEIPHSAHFPTYSTRNTLGEIPAPWTSGSKPRALQTQLLLSSSEQSSSGRPTRRHGEGPADRALAAALEPVAAQTFVLCGTRPLLQAAASSSAFFLARAASSTAYSASSIAA